MRTLFLITLCVGIGSLHAQIQCWNDSTGLIPLTDLGTDYYDGYQGGLYPGGSNIMPYAHKKQGTNISKQIKPLDTLGNVNYEDGEILFLGFGASLASNAFNAYIDSIKTAEYEGMSNCLTVKGLCFGGKDLTMMADTTDLQGYWVKVRNRMESRGDSYLQVQVIWMLQESNEDTSGVLSIYFESVMDKYMRLMQMMKDTFPNLKQIFFSGMHYTGYMDPLHERYHAFVEPRGYWGNLVIKELIKRQITGDPALKYKGVAAQSAWLGWGPYFWADGKNPRTYDGLSWDCDQFRDDPTGGGFHLEDSLNSLGVEAEMIQTFLETDPIAKIWYLDGPLWEACPFDTTDRLSDTPVDQDFIEVYPNPANSHFMIKLPLRVSTDFDLHIYNQMGQAVFQKQYMDFADRAIDYDLNLLKGIYFVEITDQSGKYTGKLIIAY